MGTFDSINSLKLKAAAFDKIMDYLENQAVPVSYYRKYIENPSDAFQYFENEHHEVAVGYDYKIRHERAVDIQIREIRIAYPAKMGSIGAALLWTVANS